MEFLLRKFYFSGLVFRLIVFSVVMACLFHSSTALNNETDRLALLAIKSKTTDPLGIMSSWNETINLCNWYGVTCSSVHQRVTELDLQSSKLSGFISPYIGNLSFLRVLNLQGNDFSGTIPPEIGRLRRLQHLLLSNNSIGGEIPSNISSCSNLVELDVLSNMLVGVIPHELSLLSNLQVITLSKNNFVGTIPASLGNLSSLVSLSLSMNNLDGRIPDSLGKLKNLTVLVASVNRLSGTVPASIFNCSSLLILDFGQNELQGHLSSDLGNTLPQLQVLSFGKNQLSGLIPPSISNSSYLEFLQLPSNNLQGQVPNLHKLVKLKRLNIGNNFLGIGQAADMNFVSSLANATVLQVFVISKNNFGGDLPRTICNFTMLEMLGFQLNNIGGQIPDCVANLENLQYFGTWRNRLSGVIPQSTGKLQNLVELDLTSNQLSGSIPSSIGNLTMLTVVQLGGNRLEGNIPIALANCQSLSGLDLSQNNLSGKIPSKLLSISTLSTALDLSNNRLTGPLPEEIGHLQNLEYLDVSENMLAGGIPSTLGSCIALQTLYMQGNFFQGSIPQTLESVKGLRELNLAYNNLSGRIPDFLVGLPLAMLNLSYNNLEGEVPSDGIFGNATAVSVVGNGRLCGGIRQLKLHNCSSDQTRTRKPSHRKSLLLAILFVVAGVIMMVAFVFLCYMFWYRNRTKKNVAAGDSENPQNVTYQSIFRATNGLSADNLIGRGSFGTVYKGTIDQDGPIVAIKVFNLEHLGASKSFVAECNALRNIRHRNLIKVVTACSSVDYQGNDFKALIYEYMVNGSLDDWLHPTAELTRIENTANAPGGLNLRQRLDIAVDVAFALEYLHHNCGTPVVHCDLKPSNVLLDSDMVAHVGDFGLAKILLRGPKSFPADQSSSTGIRGTVGYAPPEYGLGNEVSVLGDVYSFGILLLEMFTGRRPTDAMFSGALNLHHFVNDAVPDQVTVVLDHVLLKDIAEAKASSGHSVMEVLISVFEIALSCSSDLSQERPEMTDVASKLCLIRNMLH